ncbi:hypothetical protein ATANTOWER_030464 [Ataeniobius toweri]|uniref:Uncharacterized protein n=1 Tax=Ataeniobius toweri TaxID=208326 RepID=A0ABU7AHL1_9TELE|nr:hypothetical protein [Ataeniobius toweri]
MVWRFPGSAKRQDDGWGKAPSEAAQSFDRFRKVFLDPDFEEGSGPLLRKTDPEMDLCTAGQKAVYKCCVKILNKRTRDTAREQSACGQENSRDKNHSGRRFINL